MKVVHLIAPAPAGGAESVVRSVAVGQSRTGHDVEVAVLLPPAEVSPLVADLESEGITVTQLRNRSRAYLREARQVSALLRSKGAAVLHTHGFHADVIGYLATRRFRASWVTTAHGFTGGDLKNRLYEVLGTRLMRKSDAVVSVAENVRDRLIRQRVDPARVHLVANGLAPVPFLDRAAARMALGLDPGGRTVGWVGRLSKEKGADLLLDALGILRRNDITVVVVGDGPERSALERRVASGVAADVRVQFRGQVDNAARYLTAFDALVISSRTEGTPMVLLEALAAGVPVVTFSVGGIPDVVDGASAFLAPSGDVATLSAQLSTSLDRPEEASRRAAAGRKVFAARYSIETCVGHLSRLYAAVTPTQPTSRHNTAST